MISLGPTLWSRRGGADSFYDRICSPERACGQNKPEWNDPRCQPIGWDSKSASDVPFRLHWVPNLGDKITGNDHSISWTNITEITPCRTSLLPQTHVASKRCFNRPLFMHTEPSRWTTNKWWHAGIQSNSGRRSCIVLADSNYKFHLVAKICRYNVDSQIIRVLKWPNSKRAVSGVSSELTFSYRQTSSLSRCLVIGSLDSICLQIK